MNNIDVDGGILDVWKKHHASRELSDLIGKFRTFMNFRHWIAHGRFWEPSRLGMAVGKFRPDYVYQETASLLDHLKTLPENFRWQ